MILGSRSVTHSTKHQSSVARQLQAKSSADKFCDPNLRQFLLLSSKISLQPMLQPKSPHATLHVWLNETRE